MDRVLKSEILWANLDLVQGAEQAGRRPVEILSRDFFNEQSGTMNAIALTSQELKGASRSLSNYWTPAFRNAHGPRSAKPVGCPSSDLALNSARRNQRTQSES